ncbi:MAG: hypothetical protein ACPLYF_02025 [Fervidobacterium sp.]
MKAGLIVAAILVIFSAFLVWRYFSSETKVQEINPQGMSENEINQLIDATVEQEVDRAVENITETDIEAVLLG